MIASKAEAVNLYVARASFAFIFVARYAKLTTFVSECYREYGSRGGNGNIDNRMLTAKTLVQCDFDGTITEEDISFVLLDAFAQGDWRQLLRQYMDHKISVAELNTKAFGMVKADKDRLLGALRGKVKVRAGFHELVSYCLEKGLRFVIVSNGLHFYIRAVLKDLGLTDLEVHAGQATFHPEGMKVQYVGPDGKRINDGFKGAYMESFLSLGYRVIYIGNGDSDVAPAEHAHRVFATGDLLACAKENDLNCKPFQDFRDVVTDLEQMSQFPL